MSNCIMVVEINSDTIYERFNVTECSTFVNGIDCTHYFVIILFFVLYISPAILFMYFISKQIRSYNMKFKIFVNSGIGYAYSRIVTLIYKYFAIFITNDSGYIYHAAFHYKFYITNDILEGITKVFYIIQLLEYVKLFSIKFHKAIFYITQFFYFYFLIEYFSTLIVVFITTDPSSLLFKIFFVYLIKGYKLYIKIFLFLFSTFVLYYLLFCSAAKLILLPKQLLKLQINLHLYTAFSIMKIIFTFLNEYSMIGYFTSNFYLNWLILFMLNWVTTYFHFRIIWLLVFPKDDSTKSTLTSFVV